MTALLGVLLPWAIKGGIALASYIGGRWHEAHIAKKAAASGK